MQRQLVVISGLLLALTSTAGAVERALMRAAVNSITAAELQTHVDYLADDAFEGREAGHRGGRAAAGYLAQELEKRKLRGMGTGGGYYQSFGGGLRNVLALLEGTDPVLREQIVVIGGHYDHVGYGNRTNSFGPFGYVHNGADDNASGVAGLMEVVDAYLQTGIQPRRSLLFAFWDGEEKGLLGSKHWVANPTVSLKRIVAAINLDMIGRMRGNRLEIYGSRTAQGLRRLVSESNVESQLNLDFSWEMKSNSDHYSFFSKSIPVLMLHTGLHDDYHRPSDDAHLVNSQGMERISRLLFRLVVSLADRDQLTSFRQASRSESPEGQRSLERPLPPLAPRLGVRWRPHDGPEGITLTQVTSGSAAARAGLRTGDRVLSFNGQTIRDATSFRRQVFAARSPAVLVVQRPSESEELTIEVQLDGSPSRVGISWRMDSGEPGTALVTRVVPSSPAEQAGIHSGDRLYDIQGASFSDSNQLLELLTTLTGPLAVRIERSGQIKTVELVLN